MSTNIIVASLVKIVNCTYITSAFNRTFYVFLLIRMSIINAIVLVSCIGSVEYKVMFVHVACSVCLQFAWKASQ